MSLILPAALLGSLYYMNTTQAAADDHDTTDIDVRAAQPSAATQPDPTRWRHDGHQPVSYYDGNRPAIKDPMADQLVSELFGTTPSPGPVIPEFNTRGTVHKGRSYNVTVRSEEHKSPPTWPAWPKH